MLRRLGKPEGGCGPGPLPSGSRLLDLLPPSCRLLFVLLPARHRLAFNQEDLNCYYLKGSHDRSGQPSVWGTLLRVLLTRSRRGIRPTLFFPTAEDSKAVEAIEKLQNPKVVSPQPIVVFCREDKRSFYQALPGVEEVRTYAPGRTWENLKAVVALARSRVEVVSSIFSPQPAFRLQKLLFVLLPARHRLAFNQSRISIFSPQPAFRLQLLLSEGKSRSQRPAFGLGNVAPRAAHAKSAWRPPHVVFPHCGRFQSCRGHREAAKSQGGLPSTHLGLLSRG